MADAAYTMITHTDGTKCIWLDGEFFVPLDAGGEGYACPKEHPWMPEPMTSDYQYRILRKIDGIFVPRGGIFNTFEEAQHQADALTSFKPDVECKIVTRIVMRSDWKDV